MERGPHTYPQTHTHTHTDPFSHFNNLFQSCFWLCLDGNVYMKRRLSVSLFPSLHTAVSLFLTLPPSKSPPSSFLPFMALVCCSLTLIVVVLVPFFKPSKSVSYQTLYYMRTDPGSLASQHDSTSGACQPPQASRSQISTLIWTKLNPSAPRWVSNRQSRVSSSTLQPNICHVESHQETAHGNQSGSWICQNGVK